LRYYTTSTSFEKILEKYLMFTVKTDYTGKIMKSFPLNYMKLSRLQISMKLGPEQVQYFNYTKLRKTHEYFLVIKKSLGPITILL
jgi:hypothetical protein